MRVALLLGAAALVGACASTPAEEVASNDPNRLVCRYEKVTGQHRPERICMTAARRDELREQTQQELIKRGSDRANAPSDRGG